MAILSITWQYECNGAVKNAPTDKQSGERIVALFFAEKSRSQDEPVLSFREVMDHIDLSKYFADRKVCGTGQPRCDSEKLLMVVLFAFMDEGFESLRGLAKRCRNDIRYMWLLDGMEAPSFMTFSNFIRSLSSQRRNRQQIGSVRLAAGFL